MRTAQPTSSLCSNKLFIVSLLIVTIFYQLMAEVVDWSKFFQYFKKFYRNLASLEECFHEKKIKFTKNLAKLNTLTQQVEFSKETTISLEPDRTEHKKKYFIRPENHIKSKKSIPIEKSQQLNVIGQIQEREDIEDVCFQLNDRELSMNQRKFQSRVGTAEGARHKMSVTIDFQNARPMTGVYKKSQNLRKNSQKIFNNQGKGSNERYRSLTKYQKTIDESTYNDFIDQRSEAITEKKIFNVGKRKSIYDVLEEQKRSVDGGVRNREQFFDSELIRLPSKKKNKTFSRWSFKINKLL